MKNFSKRILTGEGLFSLKSTLMLLALSFFAPNVFAIEENLEVFAQQLMEGLEGPFKIAVQPINKKEADLPAGTTLILEEQVSNAVQMAAFNKGVQVVEREELAKIMMEQEEFQGIEEFSELLANAGADALVSLVVTRINATTVRMFGRVIGVRGDTAGIRLSASDPVELTLPVNYAIGIKQIVVQGRNEKRYVRAIARGLNEIDGITVVSERGKHLRDFELSIEIEFDMGDKETEESRTAKQSGQTLGTIGSGIGQLGGAASLFGSLLGAAGTMQASTAADKESTIMIVAVSGELLNLKDDSVLTEDVLFRKEVKKWTSNIEKKAYLKEAISEALRTTGRKIAYQVMDLEPPEASADNSQAVSNGSSGSSQSSQTSGTSSDSESGLFSLLKSSAATPDSGSSDRKGDGGTSQSFATAAPRLVTLIVRSNVENNRVFIDGEFAGSTRLDTKLPLGLHLVRVEKDGYNPFEESVNLQEALTLRVELVKIKEKTVMAAVPGAYTLTLVGFDKKAAIGLKRFLKGLDEVSKTKTVSITTAQRVYALFTDADLDIVEELIVEGLMEVDVDIDSARIELSETEILVDITGGTASVTTTGSSSVVGTTSTVTSSESQSASLTKSDESAADLQPEPQSDLKEAPDPSTQNIAGLWIDDRSCHISIFENQAGNLVGAAWGSHGGSMQIVLTPLIGNERRFDWKGQGRTMFEASLSDPRKTGRFTINTYDENKLHTSVNICSKKGSGGVSAFHRANSFSSYRVKPPRWYAASLQ
jgi:hypothetical protein